MTQETDDRIATRANFYARLVVDLAAALGKNPPALDDPQAGADLVAHVRALVAGGCPRCDGDGLAPDDSGAACGRCGGSGRAADRTAAAIADDRAVRLRACVARPPEPT